MCPFDLTKCELDFQRSAALTALLEEVSLHLAPFELLKLAASCVRPFLDVDFLTLFIADSVRGTVKTFQWDGAEWPREPAETAIGESEINESVAAALWQNQTPLLIENLLTESLSNAKLAGLQKTGAQSFLAVPLTRAAAVPGAIGFASRRAQAFGPGDVDFLSCIASVLSLVFDNLSFDSLSLDPSLTQQTFAEEKARLRLLFEIAANLRSQDFEQSIAFVLESLQRWAGNGPAGLYVYDDVSGTLHLRLADEKFARFAEKMSPQGFTPLEGSLAGATFLSRQSTVLDHPSLARSPFPSVQRGMELGVRCLCLTPILSSQGSLGVLKIARLSDHPFSAQDVELLERIAAALVPTFERAQKAGTLHLRPAAGIDPTAGTLLEFAKTPPSAGHEIDASSLQSFPSQNDPVHAFAPNRNWFGPVKPLLESEQLLAAYFQASNVGICILDSNLRYLAINETLAAMHGVPALAHLGKTVHEVLGDFDEVVKEQTDRVFNTGEPVLNRELSSTLPTRSEPGHWIAHYIPIRDTAGVVAQIGVIAVEVTQQKKLEESLRGVSKTLRREKQRSHILTEIGHLLSTSNEIGESFPQISAYLRRILLQEYAALILHDPSTGKSVCYALDFPLRKTPWPDAEIAALENSDARVFQKTAPVLLTDDEMHQLPSPMKNQLQTEGLKSLCCVPLLRPEGPLGLMVLGSTRREAFTTDDVLLLNQVAAQLAIALESQETTRKLQQFKTRFDREKVSMQVEPEHRPEFAGIIGQSAALCKVLGEIRIVAPSQATVLLLGETGTGKGLVARALHQCSSRNQRPFVTLNCAAIPTGLLESELFGHEKGAFTGAVNQKVGRLEAADGGTIFLDEIGEISSEMQPKLLRVLQDHEFERLGGVKTIKVDIRLVAATNRDLARSVLEKEFRSDLFYRLNVFPIRLPSLRERREDIPILVRHFVRKYAARMGRTIDTIPDETMDALVEWDWPGNVRELENFIERSVILSAGAALSVPLDELSAEPRAGSARSLNEFEREHILQVLRETGGILSGPNGAAARLNIKRTTLQSKMERLGITRADYEDPGAA